jgi:hypothetical protein
VDPHNQPTTWRIEYGTTPAYGASTLETPLPAATGGRQPVSVQLTGLRPNRTYHYRVVATNALGTVTGEDRIFQAGVASRYSDLITSTTRAAVLLALRRADRRGRLRRDRLDARAPTRAGTGSASAGRSTATRTARPSSTAPTRRCAPTGPVVSRNATIEGWWRWKDGAVLLRDDSAAGGWFIGRESNGRLGYRVAGRSYRTNRRIGGVATAPGTTSR